MATAITLVLASGSAELFAQQNNPPNVPPGLKRIDGTFHTLFYDITDDEAVDALARMEAMVREYSARTSAFSGKIRGRLPFLLFRRDTDYIDAGGMEGSAGMFDGQRLMAVAGRKITNSTWHTIQHEGFHQFARTVIGGQLPPWVNEGMAEYFGEGVYCGDGFVTGAVPNFRLKRIQQAIEEKQFRPMDQFMLLSQEQWNGQLTEQNYDQAWSIVQFLAHGDNGKYQQAFTNFMIELGRGGLWQPAWDKCFGRGDGFEQAWRTWWLKQKENPTLDVYATAAVRMLGNYSARATSQKQTFESVEAFHAAIRRGSIKTHPADALPPSLAGDCADLVASLTKVGIHFAFDYPKKGPTQFPSAVIATLPDGRTITGTVTARGPRAGPVTVTTKSPTKKSE
ncbi:MAG: DUF1570 domain-containing protein [Tepidisphaeraceae bacterium]